VQGLSEGSLGCLDRLPAWRGPGTLSQVNDPESSEGLQWFFEALRSRGFPTKKIRWFFFRGNFVVIKNPLSCQRSIIEKSAGFQPARARAGSPHGKVGVSMSSRSLPAPAPEPAPVPRCTNPRARAHTHTHTGCSACAHGHTHGQGAAAPRKGACPAEARLDCARVHGGV